MKLKEIELKDFRRFSHLVVRNIPETAKLIILVGPNGCGKSSLFDAFNTWHKMNNMNISNWSADYHTKSSAERALDHNQAINIKFHTTLSDKNDERRKAFYFRSAYRNEADFRTETLHRMQGMLQESRFNNMIDNDASVSTNYSRLASSAIEDVFGKEDGGTTFSDYREKMIGAIKESMLRIFPHLTLNGLGKPLDGGTFLFSKGISLDFPYKNLSGGEKACFDLLLDIHVKSRAFDDTVFCIDEPESHMNTRIQAALLGELYNVLPDKSQLCISTHSIGMIRKARDLEKAHPETVVFLDFDKDFDQFQVVEPIVPNRVFWNNALNVALDDMADLMLPEEIVLCEGSPKGSIGRNSSFDAECYNIIFQNEFSQTQFVSAGNAHDVENDRLALMRTLQTISGGVKIHRLIDKDDHSDSDISQYQKQGMRVLSRRAIENYLFDDEILSALCGQEGRQDAIDAILAAKRQSIASCADQGKPVDDIKSASGLIYTETKKILGGLPNTGNNARAFMKNKLAPLLRPHMAVYQELKTSIFG